MHASKRTLAVGQSIPCTAGRHTVTIRRQEHVIRVETTAGNQVVDQLTRSFPTDQYEITAGIGRVIVYALRETDATVETARTAVVAYLDTLLAALLDDPSPAATAAADRLIAIKHWFEPVEVHAWRDAMAADMNAFLGRTPTAV